MNVILVFPKPDAAKKIRLLLMKNGYTVDACVTTVAGALRAVNEYEGGIIVSNYRFTDGMAIDIHEACGGRYQMLLIGPKDYIDARAIPDLFSLTTPLQVSDLLTTMETMSYAYSRNRKRMRAKPRVRDEKEKQIISQAKGLLMERNQLSEEEAHRYIQKSSMDNGTGLVETAQMILSLMHA